MSALYFFPDQEKMVNFLSNHDSINLVISQEKRIIQTIAKLAAGRFANGRLKETGIKVAAATLICDLQRGLDGYTGAKIPKINLSGIEWACLSTSLETALRDCAKSYSK